MIYTKRGWKDITDNSEYRQANISISKRAVDVVFKHFAKCSYCT